jgi:hypothetical protein
MYPEPKQAYQSGNNAGRDECRAEVNYSVELSDAKSAVEHISNMLQGLASAIRGPRPEPAGTNTQPLPGQRSLKDSLDAVPAEIRDLCMHAEKQIAEIRAMLRL